MPAAFDPCAEDGGCRDSDILVTALRRPTTLLETPVSILVFDQTDLDRKHVRDMNDLSFLVPGLTFSPGWGDTTHISLRGIASSVGTGTTGIYLNNTPIQVRNLGAGQTATNVYPAIFDIARVEVLRGPQGTLFGAGSEGGTVRFITPGPSFTSHDIYVRAEQSFTKHGGAGNEIGAAIGAPILTDRVGLRISGDYRKAGGWVDRVDPVQGTVIEPNANSTRMIAFRATLGIRPTHGLTITPAFTYQKLDSRDTSFLWRHLSDPGAGQLHNAQSLRQPSSDRHKLYSVDVEYETGTVSLFSSTSFFERRDQRLVDYTNFGAELLGLDYQVGLLTGTTLPADMRNRQKILTQEVRIQSADDGRLRWVLGGFYQNAKQYAAEKVGIKNGDALLQAIFGTNIEGVFGVPLVQPGDLFFTANDRARDRQIAGFAQVDLELLPALTATVGIRVTKADFQADNEQGGPLNGGTTMGRASHSENPVTPKFGLSYKLDRDALLYVSAAKGFRIGGGNNAVPAGVCKADLGVLGLAHVPQDYGSDSLWSYEAGVKLSAFEQKLQFEGSAFHIDWKNIQSVVPLNSCGFSYVDNLGSARSRGFDLHMRVSPSRGLKLDGALAYTSTEFRNTIRGGIGPDGQQEILVAQGDPLHVVPWKLSVSGEYAFRLFPRREIDFYINGEHNYSSGYSFGSENTIVYDPFNNRQDATNISNLRFGLRNNDMDISIFIDNLFNSQDRIAVNHNSVQSALFRDMILRPRTFGIVMSYRH